MVHQELQGREGLQDLRDLLVRLVLLGLKVPSVTLDSRGILDNREIRVQEEALDQLDHQVQEGIQVLLDHQDQVGKEEMSGQQVLLDNQALLEHQEPLEHQVKKMHLHVFSKFLLNDLFV